MATWTNIPDSVLEPGKPARSVDALALRDNPIAIAQGAAGAPRVQTGGLANNAVTNEKIANMDAGKLNTGTVPGARMPMTHGAVGTYALVVRRTNQGTTNWGQTIAGSNLTPVSITDDSNNIFAANYQAPLAGTWRVMGYRVHSEIQSPGEITLAVRIS